MSATVTLRTELGDEQLELPELEARARAGELSPNSLVRIPALTGEHFLAVSELELLRTTWDSERASFPRAFALTRFPWLTLGLMAVQLLLHGALSRGGPPTFDTLVRAGARSTPLILELGEGWRLLAANFLHLDALHVGFNLFVLFLLGGALESVFRRLDAACILLWSGLVTMLASLVWVDGVTVGASGMVHGALGALVAFGLRHRELLPRRHRLLLAAAIPGLLLLLWLGGTRAGVDHAAHLGGLVAGLLLGALFRPRLLEPSAARRPGLLVAGSLAVLLLLPATWTTPGGGLRPVEGAPGDVGWWVPSTWRPMEAPFDGVAFGNGLTGAGGVQVSLLLDPAVTDGDGKPVDLMGVHAAAQGFVEEVLRGRARSDPLHVLELHTPSTALLAGRQAVVVRARLQGEAGPVRLEAWFTATEGGLLRVVTLHDEETEAYAPVLQEVLGRLGGAPPGSAGVRSR